MSLLVGGGVYVHARACMCSYVLKSGPVLPKVCPQRLITHGNYPWLVQEAQIPSPLNGHGYPQFKVLLLLHPYYYYVSLA
mmetsp:Transcript_69499/g.122680  ORF Transcript_69499/g.122680 Transcript_69499/m.122680 type:complete len:80 (-) Transcript_69499:803-1042(-)